MPNVKRNARPTTARTAPGGARESSSPIVIRFFGGSGETVGFNGDYFTVGDTAADDIALPDSMSGPLATRFRFSRGAEGWRVTLADDRPFYIDQSRSVGLSEIRSGGVIRLTPGGPGLQFTVRQQQDASLAQLAARHAPELLKRGSVATVKSQPTAASEPMRSWRDAASISNNSLAMAIGAIVLVAAALLAGYFLGASGSRPEGSKPAVESSTDPSDSSQDIDPVP